MQKTKTGVKIRRAYSVHTILSAGEARTAEEGVLLWKWCFWLGISLQRVNSKCVRSYDLIFTIRGQHNTAFYNHKVKKLQFNVDLSYHQFHYSSSAGTETLLNNSEAASASAAATPPHTPLSLQPSTPSTPYIKTAAVKLQLRHVLITTLEEAVRVHSERPVGSTERRVCRSVGNIPADHIV